MTILATYQSEPSFPPTDQHPDAQRSFQAGWWVDWTPPQPTDQEVIDHTTGRRPRQLLDIRADVLALSPGQKNMVWTQFTAGNPPRFATSPGGNDGTIYLAWILGKSGTLPAADVNEIKAGAISLYVQDVPDWLVHPTWDPSINIPGDEPVT